MSSRIIQSFHAAGAGPSDPGPGGWGLVVRFTDGSIVELGGAQAETTNNCMEMQAVTAALKILAATAQSEPVTFYTNSQDLQQALGKELFPGQPGESLLHRDLQDTFSRLNRDLIHWQSAREQSGNPHNERTDAIARAFATGAEPSPQPSLFDLETALQALERSQTHSQENVAGLSDEMTQKTLGYKQYPPRPTTPEKKMTEFAPTNATDDSLLPQEQRIAQLRHLIESLRIADEIASKGYLIGSSELADLMNVNASAVTSRGDHWPWRNWVVSRVRREGNQILWQLERVD